MQKAEVEVPVILTRDPNAQSNMGLRHALQPYSQDFADSDCVSLISSLGKTKTPSAQG